MKKILMFMAIMIAVAFVTSCGSKPKEKPKPKEIPFVSQTKENLKKWLEKTLILINSLIFIFFAMVNDCDFKGFIVLIILLIIFSFNGLIISKYGRLLKDDGEE